MRLAATTVCLCTVLASCAPRPADGPPSGYADVSDLSLVEMPLPDSTPGHDLGVILTGDGNWAALEKAVARRFIAAGIPVVAFNSRSYLMKRRTPDETAHALIRVIRHYTRAWHRDSLVLVGYSRGADILPFVVDRLPPDLHGRVALVALLAPARRAGFQFHWRDLLVNTSSPGDLPILPQVDSMAGLKVLCLYGKKEEESLCREPGLPPDVMVIQRTGGHHFDRDYPALGDLILKALGR